MLTEINWSIKELMKLIILEIFKQYVLLVMKLEIILLVWIRRILNKRIYFKLN